MTKPEILILDEPSYFWF
ncbi:hypothetical protein [Gottfriedia acidiceleris]